MVKENKDPTSNDKLKKVKPNLPKKIHMSE